MAEALSEDSSYRTVPIPETAHVTTVTSWSPLLVDHPVLLGPDATYLSSSGSRAQRFLDALRKHGQQLVEVELGVYDDIFEKLYDRFAMPLGRYVDWLEETKNGRVNGKQLYLAQWYGREQLDAVGAKIPRVLQPLLDDGHVDLYTEATFLGPTGAVTPFHYDPYMNLFHLQASPDPSKFAKHVLLLPQSVSSWLQAPPRGSILDNTSQIRARLRRRVTAESQVDFQLQLPSDLSDAAANAIADNIKVCILREGDTLFIPRGWWHRVENVSLNEEPHPTVGWTAAVSWWFLPRGNSKPSH